MEARPHQQEQEERVADGREQHPQRGDARAGVDERDAERQQDPADHVVADAGGEHHDADGGAQELELGEDAAEDGEGLNTIGADQLSFCSLPQLVGGASDDAGEKERGRLQRTVMAMATPMNTRKTPKLTGFCVGKLLYKP